MWSRRSFNRLLALPAMRLCGQGVAVERLDARAQPPEVGIELDHSPGDDEHGLEDAPAGIGMGKC